MNRLRCDAPVSILASKRPRFDDPGEFMEGVRFLTNEKGERVAVQIDLRRHGDIWEDVYDSLIARQRRQEPRESIDVVRKRLVKRNKLNG
jgi:hypothetical protein